MGISAAALALARPFEFEGETHDLHPLTYEDLARFSLWMEERARLAAVRAVTAGQEAKEIYAAFLAAVAGCTFEPGSDEFDTAARSPAGTRKLLGLMLHENGKEDVSWRIFANVKEFERVAVEMHRINSDPKVAAIRRCPIPPADRSP